MPAFTDLPPELLQLIAGTCPALDILALSRTCRHLKKTCDTAAVYQMSFEQHLPELTSNAFSSGSALTRFMQRYVDGPNKPCQRNDGPKKAWLCLAVAVSRFQDVLPELRMVISRFRSMGVHFDEDRDRSLSGLIGFLATLPVWGCTAACNIELASILDDVYGFFFPEGLKHHTHRQYTRGELPLQFAFCLAMSGLESCRAPQLEIYDLSHNETIKFATYNNLVPAEGRYSAGMGQDHGRSQGSWIDKQSQALLLVDLIARNSCNVTNEKSTLFARIRTLGWRFNKDKLPPELPNPRKIEFLGSWYFAGDKGKDIEHVATPLRPRFPLLEPHLIRCSGGRGRYFQPFAGDEWWSWYTTRVRDLSRRLDEGEWYGTYAPTLLAGSKAGSPLERIRFRKTSADGDTYAVEAPDGIDYAGTFTLQGEIKVSDMGCTVRLQKQYKKKYSSAVHYWRGTLTPLGICGDVYDRISAKGYFWLWKREWMNIADK
ncbi:hypothetical protein F5Y13DRAFT_103736 [Hypoxylon sp. FL1857]|nr:hypothetical protein F5Y13DRAFT_103736 [Hypoxylon sp. FL1857]